MPAHGFGIPALPQSYHQEGAAHSGSTEPEISCEDAAQEAPVVRNLTQLPASLGAALAILIALHLLSVIRTRKQHTDVQKRELLDVDKKRPI